MREDTRNGEEDARRSCETDLARRMPLWAQLAALERDTGISYPFMEQRN